MSKNYVLIILLALIFSCRGGAKSEKAATGQSAMTEITIQVSGMHCAMCEASIEKGVTALAGVDSVKAVLSDSTAWIRFDPAITSVQEIAATIEKRGYKVKGD